jgi:hypothetical protein
MPELRASRAESSITGVEAVGINVEAFCFDAGAFDCIAGVPGTNDGAAIPLIQIVDNTHRTSLVGHISWAVIVQ